MSRPVLTASIIYFLVVLVIFAGLLIGQHGSIHYTAARFMDANTRIVTNLLVAPKKLSLSGILELREEQRELVGQYLKKPLHAGDAVKPGDASPCPDLRDTNTFGLELDKEPDGLFLNAGTIVAYWVPSNATPHAAMVTAIVQAGPNWLALLTNLDGTPANLASAKPAAMAIKSVPQTPANIASPPVAPKP